MSWSDDKKCMKNIQIPNRQKIYANGCSYTYGEELSNPAKSAWPVLLSDRLNATVVNDASSGGTNYSIMYNTIKNLQDNFDLYVIAWTTYTRFTFYKSDNNFEVNFNPRLQHGLFQNESFYKKWGTDLYRYWFNRLFAFKLWLQQIIQLQALFRQQNKNYIMLNAWQNNLQNWLVPKDRFNDSVRDLINFDIMNDEQILEQHREIQYYISVLDKSKFYKWEDFYLQQLCSQFPCGPGGHILEEGHIEMANQLYNFYLSTNA